MKATPTLFFALFATLFLVIFNYTITLMAGLYIVSELGGSTYIGTYTVSFFALGNAIGVPLGRLLVGRLGDLEFLVVCLVLFMLCSLGCVLAPTFFVLVLFRFLQGVVSGPFYTLLNPLFARLTPPEKKPLFTSLTLTIFVTGPVLGAAWGGWIAYDYEWRHLFYLDFPLVLTLSLFLATKIKHFNFKPEKIPFDGVGYFFYTVGLCCLCFFLITGQEFDWLRSPWMRTALVVGGVSFLFFVLWSLNTSHPIVDFRLLKNPSLSFALFNLFFLFTTYFGTVILLALWLSLYVNYTPIWVALLLGTMALAGILPSFLILHKLGKMDHRIPLGLAIILFGGSCFHTSYFNVDIDFERIAISRVMAGFGLALFLPPIFRLAFRKFSEERGRDVVVVFQFVRALSSGLGAALFVILWQRREVFYHSRLGSALTPFSQKTKTYFVQAKQLMLQGGEALAELDVLLERQSIALALDDCFYFMGWIMVALFVINLMTLFSRRIDFAAEI